MMVAQQGEDEGAVTMHTFEVSNPTVPHYYGDTVRRIFIGTAFIILFVFASPFLVEPTNGMVAFGVIAALVLACLAACTNPRHQWVMVANALTAGGGVLFAELFAITSWRAGFWGVFLASEGLVIAFLFALYFSVKTVRAMLLGQIGRRPTVGEFLDDHRG